MELTTHRSKEASIADRRLYRRYPIDVELEYKLVHYRHQVETGRGRTVNASSSGILFESEHALPAGLDIELSIAWPARLGDGVPLKLYVCGLTVRGQGQTTAVKIVRHTFRTRGSSDGDSAAITLQRIRKDDPAAGPATSQAQTRRIAGPNALSEPWPNRPQTTGSSERAAFLAQACASDPELRREVESLLARERRAERLRDEPAARRAMSPNQSGTLALGMLSVGELMAEYRIVGALGSGGMGEVYRATDTRLEREVALKVLAGGFAHDSAWMSRFEREARVLASLNHPHIAAIYGLEESEGQRAIAMELVEGPTLAERMLRGRVPVQEAISIARQIAEALEYAHEKGIVHRDLKPANVKLRPDGVVKVLDFGLAKAVDANEGDPTTTRAGIILGTPAYMPPEQASGMPVDRRADIWAFGAVLFEMLSGKQVYARKTTLETLAAIARDEPRWEELPVETPPAIAQLLARCLDRNPKTRLRDIGEARIALEERPPEEKAAPRPARWRARGGWIAAGILAVAFAALAAFHFREARMATPAARFAAFPLENTAQNASDAAALGITPNSRRLAYVSASADGQVRLWVPPPGTVANGEARPVEDGESGAGARDSSMVVPPAKTRPVYRIADYRVAPPQQ